MHSQKIKPPLAEDRIFPAEERFLRIFVSSIVIVLIKCLKNLRGVRSEELVDKFYVRSSVHVRERFKVIDKSLFNERARNLGRGGEIAKRF